MTDNAQSTSIFDGTDEIIASALDLRPGKRLKQKSTCRRLANAPLGTPILETLVTDLYERISGNWTGRIPSRENWRHERQTKLSPENKSPEILLERAIALLGSRGLLEEWFNQVPVASGLIDGKADKRAAVDLVCHRSDRADFVELKWGSDTPAFAAFEILRYGLVYLFSFIERERFGYLDTPFMNVSKVNLRVLAPLEFYDSFDLPWLGHGLNEGVRTLAAKKTGGALSMGFGFLAFPSGFDLPFETGEQVLQLEHVTEDDDTCRAIVSAIRNLEPVWDNGGKETP
ncbi:MAG: hypothetical protein O6850_06580 [Acidobacteria bacterium]|nr:hypothetical protein [Acidobacteriota bacterium]